MTDLTRATKAQLLNEVQRLNGLIKTSPTLDDEARAIDACSRALDRIKPPSSPTYGSGKPNNQIARVLRYLAQRYGVELVTFKTVPCDRAHVDELGMVDLSDLARRP